MTHNIPLEEIAHQVGNHFSVFLQCEVPGVEQVEVDVVQIALVWFGAFGGE